MRKLNSLTPKDLAKAIKELVATPGHHGLGDGLYFRVEGGEKAYWIYRYVAQDGKRRVMSLGPYPEVSLADARLKHGELRKRVVADKVDPLAQKRAAKEKETAQRKMPTFGEVADEHLRVHQASRKNDRHRRQWHVALKTYCEPIRGKPVDKVDTEAVLGVLKPVWTRAPEIASRLRGRIEAVLSAAQALGHIPPDRANVARWRGHLDHLLPKPSKVREPVHHAAMRYAEVPAFMEKLKGVGGTATQALRFTVLCASRSSEVFGMTWDEVDLAAKTWTVPGERMKMGVEHVVPLGDAAIEILSKQLAARRGEQPYVFPGAKFGRPLSNMAMAMTLRRYGAGQFTVHGFRSAFRDWAADHGVEFEVAEACLAHAIGNAVTRAYLRTTMLERRRKVMADWAAFLAGRPQTATVVPLRPKRPAARASASGRP